MATTTISRSTKTNLLYSKYYNDVISYKNELDSRLFTPTNNLDFVIKLHFCFEYDIHDFFRDAMLHNTGVAFPPSKSVEYEKKLNDKSIIEKLQYYIGLNNRNKGVLQYINQINVDNFCKENIVELNYLIDKVIEFNTYRNIVYHGSDLSTSYKKEKGSDKFVYEKYKKIETLEGIREYILLYEEIFTIIKKYTVNEYKFRFKSIFKKD